MRVFAVVFAIESDKSEKALSAAFSPEEHAMFTAAMLEDVLAAVGASTVSDTLAIGNYSSLKTVADWCGISFLSKENATWDSAVHDALVWCAEKKADAVLFLLANIPFLASVDVDRIITLGSAAPSLVLALSIKGGANAIFLNPSDVISAQFGPDSFFNLVKKAMETDVPLKFYSARSIAFDLESPEDMRKLFEIKTNAVAKRVFKEITEQRSKKR
jgi:2-phospho-L-lactate guanylyltransferase (CobY/MobA/RfbA family)